MKLQVIFQQEYWITLNNLSTDASKSLFLPIAENKQCFLCKTLKS